LSKKVRVGVIGAGSWAIAMHIPILLARDDVDLVSVCSRQEDAISHLKNELKIKHVTEDHKEVINKDLDAIVVASPPSLHFEHARDALESGANVLCEKPFTLTPDDAWFLDSYAKKNNRSLLIAFGWNYKDFTIEAKSLMEENGIGEIQHSMLQMATSIRSLLKTTSAFSSPDSTIMPDHNTWTNPRVSGGGYAQAQLSHAAGALYWLAPELKIDKVFSLMNFENSQVDLNNSISVQYENGSTGVVSGACSPDGANYGSSDEWSPRHQLVIRIYGSEGQLILDFERDFFWFYRSDGLEIKKQWPGGGLYECDGPANTLVDLTLNKKVENRSPAEVGAKTVELISTAYKSIESKKLESI
jgi:predicted dehydrogenase